MKTIIHFPQPHRDGMFVALGANPERISSPRRGEILVEKPTMKKNHRPRRAECGY